MPFNVLFRGLVCHLTEEKMSVFVHAPKHELRLVVNACDVVSACGFERDDVHTQPDPDDPQDTQPKTSFKVAGGRLRILGVEDHRLTANEDFSCHVPSLRKGAHGTIRRSVLQRKPAENIAGYFEYPGGTFSVRKYFAQQALFNSTTADCIAQTVQLSFATNGRNVTIRDGDKEVTLKPQARVMFVNGENSHGLGAPNQHFHHYYDAIYSTHEHGAVPQSVETFCGGEPGPVFPGMDCSNSQWP